MIRYSYIVIDRLAGIEAAEGVPRTLEMLKTAGYEGVELNLSVPLGVSIDDLERWVGETGLVIPSFLTGESYHDGLCLSSPDAQVRSATVDRLIGFLDIAERFQAFLVIGLLQGLSTDEPDSSEANLRIADGLRQIAEQAEPRGLDLVIEPVNHLQVGFNNSVAEVNELIANVGSTAVYPMVDTIHMNIEERSLSAAIRACRDRLRHVHLCESNGRAFGTGNVDFDSVFTTLEEIGYDGFVSIKVYREPLAVAAPASLDFLRNRGRGPDA
ncbi:MAG: hypothetical protein CMJ59_11010 [Planctomycetaceae bacterium]|nr:hypothetical protein [Planctomycetaceae bacterium]